MNLSDLLKLWRVEKGSAQIAKMPAKFYEEAVALTKDANPFEAKKAKDLYIDIVHMRQHKMLMACLRELNGGDGPENLLEPEKRAYKKIFDELKALRVGSIEPVRGDEETKDWADYSGADEPEGQETLSEEDAKEKEEGPEEKKEEPKKETEPDETHVAETDDEDVSEPVSEGEESEKTQEETLADEEPGEVPKAEPEEVPEESDEESQDPEDMTEEPSEDNADEKTEDKTNESEESIQTPDKARAAEREVQGTEPADKSTGVDSAGSTTGQGEGPKQGLGVSQAEPATDNPVFKQETENKGRKKVRFLRPMPAFVGPDMETLGPFDEDEEAELDGEIVEILITNDAVELT